MKIDEYLHKIKIDNFQEIKKLLDQSEKMANKRNNLQKENTAGKQNSAPAGKNELITLLQKLNPEIQKNILTTLAKMNLPLTKKNLSTILKFINDQSISIEKEALIKSLALIIKNGLPSDKNFVEGIASNFDNDSSQTNIISNLLNSMQKENISYLLKEILIDPSRSKEELTAKIKNYPALLQQVMQELLSLEEKNENENKLFNQLLGQKIINKQEGNLLLTLELPLNWPENDKKTPFYLEIWEDDDKDKKNDNGKQNSTKTYKIAFSIELQNKGLINALLQIKNKTIIAHFYSNKEKTITLLKNEISTLKKKMNDNDYDFTVSITQKEKKELKKENNLALDFNQNTNTKAPEGYKHIDFKV